MTRPPAPLAPPRPPTCRKCRYAATSLLALGSTAGLLGVFA